MGKMLGRSQNSGGSGLQPDHSYTPSTYTREAAFQFLLNRINNDFFFFFFFSCHAQWQFQEIFSGFLKFI
jgi:hypothetical protein